MRFLFSLLLCCSCSFTFADNISNEKAIELMKVLGVDEAAITKVKLNVKFMKESNPNIPAEYFDRFMKEVTKEKILEIYAPVYSHYYSAKDMEELLRFFATPIGKKYVAHTSTIITEASKEAEKWSREISQKVAKDMGLN